MPVGSIIPFYDYNGLVSFDTSYWVYCDGSVINNPSSPLNGQTTPDLSNRYLVGFGTEGGGDIDTAAWATAAVGNASHRVDLSHTHTGPSHTHDVDIGSFTSGGGTEHLHRWGEYDDAAGNHWLIPAETLAVGGQDMGAGTHYVTSGWGSHASTAIEYFLLTTRESSHTHSINPPNTTSTAAGTGATGSALSATQSIQPRSVRVRYIMRVK